jgi:hypothetical protein
MVGDKENYIISRYCKDFCRTGQFATASVNYRLIDFSLLQGFGDLGTLVSKGYTRKKIFEAVGDVRRAIKFFKDNNERLELGIDPEQIYVVGFSAGGIIANHLLFTDFQEANDFIFEKGSDRWIQRAIDYFKLPNDFFRIDNRDYFEYDMSTELKGVVSIGSGVLTHKHIEDTELENISLLLIHGTDDRMVGIGKERPFEKYVQNVDVPLVSLFWDLGILETYTGEPSGKKQAGTYTQNGNLTIGPSIPDELIRVLVNIFTSDICGSACIFEQMANMENCKLVEIQEGPHVFMLNKDGSFNKTYQTSRKMIYDFIRDSMN